MLEKATCGVIVVKSEIPLSWLFKSLTPFLYIRMISKHFNDYECLFINSASATKNSCKVMM